MKLDFEMFRYGMEMGVPLHKRGRVALVIRTDLPNHLHIDVMAGDDDRFELLTISKVVERLMQEAS